MPLTESFDECFGTGAVLERDGCPIHYWLTGPDRGPLVVLTHGAGIDHWMFAAQVPPLAERYHVLTWDMRGHGRSRSAGSAFSVEAALADLRALLDLLGATSPILIGHSLGGNLIQEWVFRQPHRARALVLIDCTCNTLPISRWERLLLAITPPLLHLYPWGLLRRQMAAVSSVDPAVRHYLEEAFARLTKEELIRTLIAGFDFLHPEPAYRINLPFLLLVGERDGTGNIRNVAPRWAQRDPLCQLAMIPRAGHCANQDNPGGVNRLMLDFLARL